MGSTRTHAKFDNDHFIMRYRDIPTYFNYIAKILFFTFQLKFGRDFELKIFLAYFIALQIGCSEGFLSLGRFQVQRKRE